MLGDSVRLRLTQRLSLSLLSTISAACAGTFVDVVVPPGTCTSTAISGEQRPLECAEPMRFGWARANARIAYPPVLAQAGVSGRVGASAWVAESGAMDSVTITAATNRQFSASVERALRTWRFPDVDGSSTATLARGSIVPIWRMPRSRQASAASCRATHGHFGRGIGLWRQQSAAPSVTFRLTSACC